MSKKTFLELGEKVAVKARLDKPVSLIGSVDESEILIRESLQDAALIDVMRAENWSILRRRYTFSFTTDTQAYDLPEYFDRIVDGTIWDQENDQPIIGPLTNIEWEAMQSGLAADSGVTRYFTIMRDPGTSINNVMYIYPTPGTYDPLSVPIGGHVAYWYIISQYVYNTAKNPDYYTEFTNDGHYTLLDDELVIAAAVVRARDTLGLDYAEQQDRFEAMKKERISKDGGSPRVNMASPSGGSLGYHLPETGYG